MLKLSLLNKKKLFIALAAIFVSSLTLRAETPEEKGLSIAQEMDKRDTGWTDMKVDMKMVLRNRHGESSTRELRNKSMEVKNDGDKTLVVFDRPRDVKGTALLTFTHKSGPDDQWLYLPALKRVKRIASNNKAGPFMGSEFAYEDIASQEVEKYTYKYLRGEDLDGNKCFLVERDPVDPKSGYTRQEVWVDQNRYIPLKINFYDRKNDLLKTLTFVGYKQYIKQYWRADKMEMVNHQTGKSTDLLWENTTFKNSFRSRDFDRASLSRAR